MGGLRDWTKIKKSDLFTKSKGDGQNNHEEDSPELLALGGLDTLGVTDLSCRLNIIGSVGDLSEGDVDTKNITKESDSK